MTRLASDRDAAGIRGVPKKRSKAQQRRDLLRASRENTRRLAESRKDRRVAWPDGQPEFATERQETRLRDLEAAKRGLRRDVYSQRPELEGRRFYPGRPEGRLG